MWLEEASWEVVERVVSLRVRVAFFHRGAMAPECLSFGLRREEDVELIWPRPIGRDSAGRPPGEYGPWALRREVDDVVRYEYSIPISVQALPDDLSEEFTFFPRKLEAGRYVVSMTVPLFDASYAGVICDDVEKSNFSVVGSILFEVGEDGDVRSWSLVRRPHENIFEFSDVDVTAARLPNIRHREYRKGRQGG